MEVIFARESGLLMQKDCHACHLVLSVPVILSTAAESVQLKAHSVMMTTKIHIHCPSHCSFSFRPLLGPAVWRYWTETFTTVFLLSNPIVLYWSPEGRIVRVEA